MIRAALISLFLLLINSSFGQDSLNVSTLFHWQDNSLPPSSFHLNTYNEVWGYTKNGEEYAIIGSTMGTHFFDVTIPSASQQVDFVAGAAVGNGIVHRDFHDYAGYLYIVCDEGPSTLQVVDMQYLPDSVHKVYDSPSQLVRAHNIFIDTANALMYVCGGPKPFSVFSLQDPENPVLVLDCEAALPWWNSTVGYVHDAYVRDNVAYCNATDALYVIDFSNLQSPVVLGSLENYPESGYNHSGWLNDAGTEYAMCDETHGMRMKLLDVTDLSDITVDALLGTGVNNLSIPHNVIYRGDILHAAYYHDGYWLWDTSDPLMPILLGFYDTSTQTHSLNYRGAWGVYPLLPSGNVLVSDMQTGLWVFDASIALGTEQSVQLPANDLLAWPSPFIDSFQLINVQAASGSYHLTVQDLAGRVIRSERINMNGMSPVTVHADDWLGGFYFLTIENGTDRWTKRVLKSSAK